MPFTIRVESFSEVGGHAANEDAFAVAAHPLDGGVRLCFVADGQGGQRGGGPAARLACSTALAFAVALPPGSLTDPRTWAGMLRVVDEAVRADPEAGLTTFVGLCVVGDLLVGVSSGDSAVVSVSGESAVELTAKQRKNPPVGSGSAVATGFSQTLSGAWKVLAMTDGVWKYVGWGTVIEIARRESGAGLIEQLRKPARLPRTGTFQDDFTVVLLEGEAPEF